MFCDAKWMSNPFLYSIVPGNEFTVYIFKCFYQQFFEAMKSKAEAIRYLRPISLLILRVITYT